MDPAAPDHNQQAEQDAGVEECNEGAEYGDRQKADYGVQKNIHKDHADQGNKTAGDQSEDLTKHGTDPEKDEHIFALTPEVGLNFSLYVKGLGMLGVGIDAVGLVELVEADGVDDQHDDVGYQGLDYLIVKLIENGGDDGGAEQHGGKGDKNGQGHVQNTGTDGILILF
jgi:hypothetical protein